MLPGVASAQLPPGKDCYAFPPGGRAGQTVEVRLGGSDWTPDVRFFVHDPRVKLTAAGAPGEVLVPEPPFWFGIKSFDNDPRLPREVTARFTLPAGLPPGPIRWSVANANGAGGGGVFIVGAGDEVTEDEGRKGPQDLAALPVTVNGRLRRIEEVDRYRFRAAASGLVTCDLMARRLGNDFHGVIEVHDGDAKVAEALDTEGTDPAVTFATEKGRTYTVAVRDLDHRGYRNFTYRLGLTLGPRLVTAVPAAGRRGERWAVEFIGYGIATGGARLERVTKEVAFPKDGDTFAYRLETPHGTTPPFAFRLGDADEQAGGRRLPVPGAVTARIERRGAREAYAFAGKKGERWEIAVQAREIGSPLAPTLTVLGPDGKPLAAADDGAPVLLTLPADGDYRAVVGDASGKTPGPDAVYRLAVQRPVKRFTLTTPAAAAVPIGGKATLEVRVVRGGGFDGPVTLSLAGLPQGVTAPAKLVIPAGAAALPVALDCAKTAGATASLVHVTGTADLDGRAVTAVATAAHGDDPFPGVVVAATMKPPFEVKSPDADNTRKAPRGATHLADLHVERSAGFAGEIVLDMAGLQSRHRQGIRGPVLRVAPGQDRVLYPVTVPEWLESTRTSRIALVAMARVLDPKGTPRYVMRAMEGQVTMSIEGALMKLSAAAEEVTAAPGAAADVPLRLARSPGLSGPVRVELSVPAGLAGLVSAAPLDWPGGAPAASLRLVSKDDPRVLGTWKLTARATGKRDGHPVVSEAEIEVEFVRPGKER